MRLQRLVHVVVPALALAILAPAPVQAADTGIGTVPQGTQSNSSYAASNSAVSNVFATPQQLSCYTPEVPYATSDGPSDGYDGETPCAAGTATTGEDQDPYATQAGSDPGNPAATPMLVKDHSESDIRVDPTDPSHLIGSSKWFVSAEGYNHVLGFYECSMAAPTGPSRVTSRAMRAGPTTRTRSEPSTATATTTRWSSATSSSTTATAHTTSRSIPTRSPIPRSPQR